MLKVTVDIIPGGDKSLRHTIKTIDVVNIGHENSPEFGNYITRCGDDVRFIHDYRRESAVLPLLYAVFEAFNRKTNIGVEIGNFDKDNKLKTYSFNNIEDSTDFYIKVTKKEHQRWLKNRKKVKPRRGLKKKNKCLFVT